MAELGLSVVVISFNMLREIPRTVRSLSTGNPRGIAAGRSINALIVAILLFVMLATSGSASSDPRNELPSAVVLVTIDTLRADHLGCYGYPRATSPFIDQLAAEGVLFERAFAMSSTTAPSHASLFTGTYLLQHGVLKNGHILPEEMLTIAEATRGAGFATGGFVSSRVQFRHGQMDQGFDTFDDVFRDTEPSGPMRPKIDKRPAGQTIDKAIEWLAKLDPKKPFFLWLHVFDPHTPYEESNVLRVEGEDADALAEFYRSRQFLDSRDFRDDPAAVLQTMSLYDGEIRYTDRELRRLFDRVVARSQVNAGKVMWILTADHGEGLGNHNWKGHGKNLYNELVRVPLIFWFSGGNAGGRRIDSVVEHVDLLPTVAEFLGIDISAASAIQGESLRPLLFDEAARRSKNYAFSQRRIYEERMKNAGPNSRFESGARYALQEGRYKYIHWTDGPDEFYDLANDPYEARDLIGKGLPDEERLREALLDKVISLSLESQEIVQPTPGEEIQERLRALGYTP